MEASATTAAAQVDAERFAETFRNWSVDNLESLRLLIEKMVEKKRGES